MRSWSDNRLQTVKAVFNDPFKGREEPISKNAVKKTIETTFGIKLFTVDY